MKALTKKLTIYAVRVVRWPSRQGSALVPWYVIAWRVLWLPVIFVGCCLCLFGIFASRGPSAAFDWWLLGAY